MTFRVVASNPVTGTHNVSAEGFATRTEANAERARLAAAEQPLNGVTLAFHIEEEAS